VETTLPINRQIEWQERARGALAGGVSSNTRLLNPHLIVHHGLGCRIWDADMRDYIDYLLGQGPNFLGYAHPRVMEKVIAAQRGGIIYAATHPMEITAAERLLAALEWPETVRFGSSSTEMVQAALRMARAATGRRRVVQFFGHYHGWIDNVYLRRDEGKAVPFGQGQVPEALDETIATTWNDIAALEQVFAQHPGEIAAVIMEPVMLNAGAILPADGYLASVRDLCSRHGTVLIFDETISGFRLALGGAAARYRVTPDLAVYGKAMAAGYPCSALVGSRDLFAGVAAGRVTHAGTFNGNVIATAAVVASLDELERDGVYPQVEAVGTALLKGLRELAQSHDLALHFQGFPMAFHASFNASGSMLTSYDDLLKVDAARYASLANVLIEHGVWVSYRGIWYVSIVHRESDVMETLERADQALADFGSRG
jgi:glutamate-1-semialdehyde 2,1-aminomutase